MIFDFLEIAGISCSAGGKEFIFNFMANGDLFGTPYGKVTIVNPGDVTATVSVQTPLITSGSDNFVLENHNVSPRSTVTIATPTTLQLSGTQVENKG